MRILWMSPEGDGWGIAYKLREAGHKVVYWGPDPENKNGLGLLPRIPEADWQDYAKRSDLVVVDANFASRRTRRSWEPSDEVLELQSLRRHGVHIIGPTPTTELFQNDRRYQRKLLARSGLESTPTIPTSDPTTLARCTLGPFGQTSLGFRFRAGEVNLQESVFPVAPDNRLITQVLGGFQSLIERTGHSSYLHFDVVLGPNDEVNVVQVLTQFVYPGALCHLGDLLATFGDGCRLDNPDHQGGTPPDEPSRPFSCALTLVRLDDQDGASLDGFLDEPGVFGAEVHRGDGKQPQPVPHGLVVGALVAQDQSWNVLAAKINHEADRLCRRYGLECIRVDDRVTTWIENLRQGGYLLDEM